MDFVFNHIRPDITSNFITVKSASKYSGYNKQYIRRLLRNGTISSKKIGQIWFIEFDDFIRYLTKARKIEDERYGPKIIYD